MNRPRGVVATCRAVLTSPGAFFAQEEPLSSVPPIRFAVVISAIMSPIGAIVGGLVSGVAPAPLLGTAAAAAIVGAIGAVVSTYLLAALIHGVLTLIGGAKKPFGTTLACVAYANAPSVLAVFPYVGGIVGGIWSLVLIGIGVKRQHRSGAVIGVLAAIALPAVSIALALGLRLGVVEAFKVPSGSMVPTILLGDHVFVSKVAYAKWLGRTGPVPGEVIVFRYPENREQDFVKRVAAFGGETIETVDGRLVVGGKLAPECFVGPTTVEGRTAFVYLESLGPRRYLTQYDAKHEDKACSSNDACEGGQSCVAGLCGVHQGPWTVAPNEVFVVGDNRNNSHDSRMWRGGLGAGVPLDDVKGRVSMVWMSFAPGGGLVGDRIGLDIDGPPHKLPSMAPEFASALEGCLAKTSP